MILKSTTHSDIKWAWLTKEISLDLSRTITIDALSQDQPGVLREQRASYDDGLRPGDVFHPDFQHGRPAYFDVSIRCTTQPAFISSCASCAGVAAAAGEVAKDEKHLAAVEKVGSDFIPLVVETFGVWTPFALKPLQNIADRTTPRSDVPLKVARKNLPQQLSVQLWSNNAKMILRYWALQGSDDDDNPRFPYYQVCLKGLSWVPYCFYYTLTILQIECHLQFVCLLMTASYTELLSVKMILLSFSVILIYYLSGQHFGK